MSIAIAMQSESEHEHMRTSRISGFLLVIVVASSAGCAATPAATSEPSASAASTASASFPPAPSAGTAPSGPAGSAIPTPTPEPVVLDASGTITADVTAAGMTFQANADGPANCRSQPDSLAVSDVTGLELGELGPGTLRAQIWLPIAPGPAALEVFIDAGDLGEGSFQPFWSGSGGVTGGTAGRTSGTASLGELKLEADAGSKPGSAPLPGVTDWPASISGTISWSCGAWIVPIVNASPPPASAAP